MKKVNNLFLIVLSLTFVSPAYSQSFFQFIYFTDKQNSPYSLDKPSEFLSEKSIGRRLKQEIALTEKDLPVNPSYLDSIQNSGAKVIYSSRWMNAALVESDKTGFSKIGKYSFVKKQLQNVSDSRSSFSNAFSKSRSKVASAEEYGASFRQNEMLQIDQMHKANYKGEGITVAVIDAGFKNANSLSVFDSLFLSNRVLATYDFVEKEKEVYDDHDHGTAVLSVMAAYEEKKIVGAAWKANYILLRSEEVEQESLLEEIYWLIAAEYADSCGADIINSSLGYTVFETTPEHNHSYSDLDGKSTIITKAAECAFETGMLVVNSAGNEGSESWRRVVAPADGPNVLTVGAVDSNRNYSSMSSIGPTADGRVKPDVVAMGIGVSVIDANGGLRFSNGTSFAAPLISGFAANLWQKFPDISNKELITLIRKSGDHYSTPNNQTGYGIPSFFEVKAGFVDGKGSEEGELKVYPNPVTDYIYFSGSIVNKIFIYNSCGQLVKMSSKSEIKFLDLSLLSPGLYHLVVFTEKKKINRTFIKK